MFVQRLNINNTCYTSNFSKQNVRNISFGHKPNSMAALQAEVLVKKYLKNFEAEKVFFLQGGNNILQPFMVPVDLLYKIADASLRDMQNFPKEHKFRIVTGRIGSGKTSFVEHMHLNELFYTPDADNIKVLLPGYNTKGAEYVHLVSCAINNANVSMACKNGINTLCQTATTFGNLDNIIYEARDYNYKDIVLIHIDTAEDVAIKRAEKRGELTGRKINPEIIKARTYIDSIVSTYKTPLRGLSQLIVYDNNGNSPVKVEDVNLLTPPAELTYVTDFRE